jgi:hypothetical protein
LEPAEGNEGNEEQANCGEKSGRLPFTSRVNRFLARISINRLIQRPLFPSLSSVNGVLQGEFIFGLRFRIHPPATEIPYLV